MKIIYLQGKNCSGKSSTLRLLIRAFWTQGAKVLVPCEEELKLKLEAKEDVKAILEMEGFKIGINTEGDYEHNIIEGIEFFEKYDCDICFATMRTRGFTEDKVKEIKKTKDVVVIEKTRVDSEMLHDIINEMQMKMLMEIYKMLTKR